MLFGKKQFEQLSGFMTSFLCFNLAGFVSMVYCTDWKAICLYIPFYNRKFSEDTTKE